MLEPDPLQLFTYLEDNIPRSGYRGAGGVFDLGDAFSGPGSLPHLIRQSRLDMAALQEAVATGDKALNPETLRFLPPVRPRVIIGVGRNYGAHATEVGPEVQEEPRLFTKSSGTVIAHGDHIVRPRGVQKLDWEGEVGVVIGTRAKDVSEADAMSHVLGYLPLNDVTAREFQFDRSPGQTTFAKSMDTFCPLGPTLLLASPAVDPAGFTVRSWVNDTQMQEGRTDDLLFPIPYLVSFISRYVALMPGDVIATGTPAGIGHTRTPPLYLNPGDTVRIEVSGLPPLVNTVTDAEGA
jgi:2-keto-4-pentenoate hydratase/2-oxohepta-3-ene-1,7-dioic acid hydratase in catechol pathway